MYGTGFGIVYDIIWMYAAFSVLKNIYLNIIYYFYIKIGIMEYRPQNVRFLYGRSISFCMLHGHIVLIN